MISENLGMGSDDKGWACQVIPIVGRCRVSSIEKQSDTWPGLDCRIGVDGGASAAFVSNRNGLHLDLLYISQRKHHIKTKSFCFPSLLPYPDPNPTPHPLDSGSGKVICRPQGECIAQISSTWLWVSLRYQLTLKGLKKVGLRHMGEEEFVPGWDNASCELDAMCLSGSHEMLHFTVMGGW